MNEQFSNEFKNIGIAVETQQISEHFQKHLKKKGVQQLDFQQFQDYIEKYITKQEKKGQKLNELKITINIYENFKNPETLQYDLDEVTKTYQSIMQNIQILENQEKNLIENEENKNLYQQTVINNNANSIQMQKESLKNDLSQTEIQEIDNLLKKTVKIPKNYQHNHQIFNKTCIIKCQGLQKSFEENSISFAQGNKGIDQLSKPEIESYKEGLFNFFNENLKDSFMETTNQGKKQENLISFKLSFNDSFESFFNEFKVGVNSKSKINLEIAQQIFDNFLKNDFEILLNSKIPQHYQHNKQLLNSYFKRNSQKLKQDYLDLQEIDGKNQKQDKNNKNQKVNQQLVLSFCEYVFNDFELKNNGKVENSIKDFKEQTSNCFKAFILGFTEVINFEKIVEFLDFFLKNDHDISLEFSELYRQTIKEDEEENLKTDELRGQSQESDTTQMMKHQENQQNEQLDVSYFSDNKKETNTTNGGKQYQNSLVPQLKESIKNYEELLSKSQENTEKIILINTLDALKKQLQNLVQKQNRSQNPSPFQRRVNSNQNQSQNNYNNNHNNNNSSNENKFASNASYLDSRRQQHLKEIFDYYCKQFHIEGKYTTFDRISHEQQTMNIQKFFLFCKEFNLASGEEKLSREELLELFKKNAKHSKELSQPDFEKIITKIAEKLYKDDLQCIEKLINKLNIDDRSKFKNNMKIAHMPFNMREKEQPKVQSMDSNKYRFQVHGVAGKTSQEVQEELEKRKQQREQKKDQNSSFIQSSQLKNQSPQIVKIKQQQIENNEQNKAKNKKRDLNLMKNKNIITWDKLEQDDKFNPRDLIDLDVEEDDIFLKEYQINIQKKNNTPSGNMKAINQQKHLQQSQEEKQILLSQIVKQNNSKRSGSQGTFLKNDFNKVNKDIYQSQPLNQNMSYEYQNRSISDKNEIVPPSKQSTINSQILQHPHRVIKARQQRSVTNSQLTEIHQSIDNQNNNYINPEKAQPHNTKMNRNIQNKIINNNIINIQAQNLQQQFQQQQQQLTNINSKNNDKNQKGKKSLAMKIINQEYEPIDKQQQASRTNQHQIQINLPVNSPPSDKLQQHLGYKQLQQDQHKFIPNNNILNNISNKNEHNYLRRIKHKENSPLNISVSMQDRANQIQQQINQKNNQYIQQVESESRKKIQRGLGVVQKQ